MAKPELAWVLTIFPMWYAEYFVGVAVLEKPLGSWEARNEDSNRVHASKNPLLYYSILYMFISHRMPSLIFPLLLQVEYYIKVWVVQG